VVKRGGALVCKECDFRTARPFKPVKCPRCGREINRLSDALTGHYLGFEERWVDCTSSPILNHLIQFASLPFF